MAENFASFWSLTREPTCSLKGWSAAGKTSAGMFSSRGSIRLMRWSIESR